MRSEAVPAGFIAPQVLLEFAIRRRLGYGPDGCPVRSAELRLPAKWRRGIFRATVAEKVIATLASVKRSPADKITLETNLQELGIDSLDVFTLLFELENAFKISIPDDEVRSIRTVNDIVEGIKKLLAAAPPDTSLGSATPAD